MDKQESIRQIFSSNLQRLFDEKGYQKNALADFVGVSDNTVTNWTHGHKIPRMDKIDKICSFFSVPRSALLEASVNIHADAQREIGLPVAMIPIYGRIVAGEPQEAVEEILGYTAIPQKARAEDYFALKVFGNSMNPTFFDGDTVIIHKQPTVENGQIAVVLIENEDATVKRVFVEEDGVTISADNPAVFRQRFYSIKEVELLPVRILGRVVSFSRTV